MLIGRLKINQLLRKKPRFFSQSFESEQLTTITYRERAIGAIEGSFIGQEGAVPFEVSQGKIISSLLAEAEKLGIKDVSCFINYQLKIKQLTANQEISLILMHALVDAKGKLDLKLISKQFGKRLEPDQFATENFNPNPYSEGTLDYEAYEIQSKMTNSYLAKYFGGLTRLTPLIVWGLHLPKEEFVEAIKLFRKLDSVSEFPEDAVIAYSLGIRYMILHDGDRTGAYAAAKDYHHGEEMLQLFKQVEERTEIRAIKGSEWKSLVGYAFQNLEDLERLDMCRHCYFENSSHNVIGSIQGIVMESKLGMRYYGCGFIGVEITDNPNPVIYDLPFWKPKFDEMMEIAPKKLVIV